MNFYLLNSDKYRERFLYSKSSWQRKNCEFVTCVQNGYKCISFPVSHFSFNGVANDENQEYETASSNQYHSDDCDDCDDSRNDSIQQQQSYDCDNVENERTILHKFNEIPTETADYIISDDSYDENHNSANEAIADVNVEYLQNDTINRSSNVFQNGENGGEIDIASNDFGTSPGCKQDEIMNIKFSMGSILY